MVTSDTCNVHISRAHCFPWIRLVAQVGRRGPEVTGRLLRMDTFLSLKVGP